MWSNHYLISLNEWKWILDSKCCHLSAREMLEDKGKKFLAALRTKETSPPEAKVCGRLRVKIVWILAIGGHLQSALSMEPRRGKCVYLFLTNSYLLHIFNLSQLYIYRKSRAKKGKAGWPDGCTKGDVAPSPSKRQKVNVEENLVNNSSGPVASTMASEMNTSPGPVTRRWHSMNWSFTWICTISYFGLNL